MSAISKSKFPRSKSNITGGLNMQKKLPTESIEKFNFIFENTNAKKRLSAPIKNHPTQFVSFEESLRSPKKVLRLDP
jgi:hypothetical protein